MAIQTRRIADDAAFAAVAAFNLLKRELCDTLTTLPHADITAQSSGYYTSPSAAAYLVTSADAAALPGVLLIANEAKRVFNVHMADEVAHDTADTTNTITTAAATDQTTANTLLNAIKAKFNLHVSQANVHFTNDGTYSVTSANATDLASSVTLANELKSDINNHIQFGFTSPSVQLVDP